MKSDTRKIIFNTEIKLITVPILILLYPQFVLAAGTNPMSDSSRSVTGEKERAEEDIYGENLGGKGITLLGTRNQLILTTKYTHSRPLSRLKVAESLKPFDAVWDARLIAEGNRLAWNYLRGSRPDMLMLHYMGADSSRPTAESCYFDYDYINRYHPEWFLLKDARKAKFEDYRNEDKRIRWNPSDPKGSYYRRFYLDIGNKEFQRWATNQIISYVTGERGHYVYGYDGLAFDNVNVGTDRWSGLNKSYPNFKYAGTPAAWHDAFFGYLKAVKTELNKRGLKLIVNHNLNYGTNVDADFWGKLYNCVDGAMSERALSRKAGKPWYSGQEWLVCIKRHEDITARGLIDWWVIYPEKNRGNMHESFLYCYCSWLLIQKPRLSLFFANNPEEIAPWYDEYNLPIGDAISTRYEQDGCWVRDFANAKIVVNPGEKSCQLELSTQKRWLDWVTKKTGTRFIIPKVSATILLPTVYDSNDSG
jgi:hypothetical protein